jgi:hypothetical protein
MSDPHRTRVAPVGVIADAIDDIDAIIRAGAARRDVRDDLVPGDIARAIVCALALDAMLGPNASPGGCSEALSALAARGLRPDGPSWRAGGV